MRKKTPNDKAAVRFRRERNMVAKHNKHRSKFHTPSKYVRRGKLTADPIPQFLIDEWWESNL
jgi:hypothetical protein